MKAIHALLAAALIAAPFGALAHGGEDHGKKKAGPVKKEQKEWGIAGDAKDVSRTIEVTMGDDMRFSPDRLEVKQGETVKFVVRNTGRLLHEMVIGTRKELDEHAALMARFPAMEHDEPYQAHVGAGKTGNLVWTFNRPGDFDFACLIAGHYQAGMTGKIKVVAPGAGAAPVPVPTQAQAAAADLTEAEVRKVDKENRKITLKHGPIKNLDMPAMTMVFNVDDAALLEKVRPGDRIQFRAIHDGGKFTATGIQVMK